MASDFISSVEKGTELKRMLKETFLLFDIEYLSKGREGCSVERKRAVLRVLSCVPY